MYIFDKIINLGALKCEKLETVLLPDFMGASRKYQKHSSHNKSRFVSWQVSNLRSRVQLRDSRTPRVGVPACLFTGQHGFIPAWYLAYPTGRMLTAGPRVQAQEVFRTRNNFLLATGCYYLLLAERFKGTVKVTSWTVAPCNHAVKCHINDV